MLELLSFEFILYFDDDRYDITFIVIVLFIWLLGYFFKKDGAVQSDY